MAAKLCRIEEEPTYPVCRLCHEHKKGSKMLPCRDTFCSECLNTYIQSTRKDNKFLCPECNTEVTAPVNTVNNVTVSNGINGNSVVQRRLEGAERQQHSLLSLRSSFADYQTSVHSLTQNANRYIEQLQNACVGTEALVHQHAQLLHNGIDERKDKIIREIRHTREEDEAILKKHMVEMKKSEETMKRTAEFLETVIDYTNKVDLPDTSIVNTHLPDDPIHLMRQVPVSGTQPLASVDDQIIFSKVKSNLSDVLSSSKIAKTYVGSPIPRIDSRGIVTRFNVDESLTGITETIDGTLAITSYTSKKCSTYTLGGDHIRNITKSLIQPITVLATASGKLLVADAGDTDHRIGYKMFYTDGEPFPCNLNIVDNPWGMAETSTGDFIICHPEKCVVGVYDRKGRFKMNIQSPEIFSNPRCVCVNINGDIVVSDFGSHSVLFFDSEGQYKFSYGSELKGSKTLQHPCGVCSDGKGNIIIADSDNHRVQLVTGNGKFKRFLLTHKDGIDEPVAVCVTKDNNLIVGEWSGKITVLNYN